MKHPDPRSRSEQPAPAQNRKKRPQNSSSTATFERGQKKGHQRFVRSQARSPFQEARKPTSRSERPEKKPQESSPLPEKIRLVRYIALAGIASRREAVKIIKNGQVSVNGEVVKEPWVYVDIQKDVVTYKGQPVRPEKPVYILLNKPKNTLCTVRDPQGRRTVMDLLEGAPPVRLYPVGRLDRNTTGILLLTNDGDLAQKLLHPRSKVPRTYRATTVKPMNTEVIERLVRGIPLADGVAQADEAHLEDPYTLVLTLHIGRKHIVRRMMEKLGYKLKSLDRIAFGPITRKGVPRGRWRFLTPQEVGWLKMLAASQKTTPDAHSHS